ncbi:MAG: GxxExxY protein [Bacteroidales bacterium]
MDENELATILVDIVYQVHITLGPGLLESVYEEAISFELAQQNLEFKRQQGIPVNYKGVKLDLGFRADIIVENKIIIEIKSVDLLASVHFKQVLTYLKLTDLRLGLLVNFNSALIKHGIKRVVNNL